MTDQEGRAGKAPPRINIFKGWCKGCGICVAFCPKKVLALDESGSPYVKDPGQCARCGLCELRCPDFAITMDEDGEERQIENEPGEGS
ncbi:MAG: ferredoxin family protein [Syntrophorhabdales bacterium]|jgi:2-oxoglutarate ferredoxin oxidoreductase subunit delta